MLQNRNYLFSASAPTLSIIPAPAPAIYCHLKLFYNSSTKPIDSVMDLDPYWIRIQELSGSGSIFGIRNRIHTCKYRVKPKMKAKDVRFKIKIHSSETQLSTNFFK